MNTWDWLIALVGEDTVMVGFGSIAVVLVILLIAALVWLYGRFAALDRVERAQVDMELDAILREDARRWRESDEDRRSA